MMRTPPKRLEFRVHVSLARALCLVLFGGCVSSCGRSTPPPADVVKAVDVMTDRAHVEVDGGVEADAPEDIGPALVDEAGWAAPAWLPPFANVRFATDPARMIAPVMWVPCRDGRVGCRELERENCGDPVPGGAYYVSQMNHGRRNWVVFGRVEAGTTRDANHTVIAVAELDGDAVLAWKYRAGPLPRYEGTANPRVVDDIPYSFVRFSNDRVRGGFNRLAILQGLPTTAAGWPSGLRVLDDERDLRGATERYFDLSTTTAGFTSEQAVAYVPLREDTPVRVFERPPGTTAFRTVQVEGDTVFWEATLSSDDGRRRSEQWFVRGNTPPQRLIESGAYELRGFDTDGTTMVWVLGLERAADRSAFTRSELWVAPYTTDPAALRPRRLLRFGASNVAGAHAMQRGFYAVGNFLGPFYVVDLRDGSYWEVMSQPGGMRLLKPIFISDTEVGFEAWFPSVICFTLVRLRIDSLGPRHPPQSADAGM